MTEAINRFRAQRTHRAPTRMEITGDGTATLHRPGGYTKFEFERNVLKWATSEYVSQEFLDLLAAQRNMEQRAPLGDSHGGYQKVAEIPASMLFDKIPPDAWDDKKAVNRILNDPDLRAFRTDGTHRVA
jgi:hypothetical protein